jgi:WD40 repeat protein
MHALPTGLPAAIFLAATFLAQAPLGGQERTLRDHSGWVGALAVSPDSSVLASGGADRKVRLWDPAAGVLRATLEGHDDCVMAVAFGPGPADGILASGGYDGAVWLWDWREARLRRSLSGHRGAVLAVAFSPDGALLATGGVDAALRLWDGRSGAEKAVLRGHKTWINGLAFSPAGPKNVAAPSSVAATLASGGSDGAVKLWDPAAGKETASVEVRSGEVRCVAFSPDGGTIAAGVRYGTVRLFEVPSRPGSSLGEKGNLTGHESDVWSVAFSPDGRILASGDGDWNRPGEIKLRDTVSGQERTGLQHSGEVLCLVFEPRGRWLAAGSWDGTVKVWDLPRSP